MTNINLNQYPTDRSDLNDGVSNERIPANERLFQGQFYHWLIDWLEHIQSRLDYYYNKQIEYFWFFGLIEYILDKVWHYTILPGD